MPEIKFDDEFQRKILACMLKVSEFNAISCQYLKPKHFEGMVLNNISKTMIDFNHNYNTCISSYAFTDIIKKQFDKDKDNLIAHLNTFSDLKKIDVSDSDFVLDKLIEFIKVRQWKLLIEDAVNKHLDKDRPADLKSLESEASKIINISKINKSEGYDYFDPENIKSRASARVSAITIKIGITTGIPELNKRMYGGGYMPGELYIILASAKRGKTQKMLWNCNTAAYSGKNAVYFTCEVSRSVCCDRLDASNTGIAFSDLSRKSDDVVLIMKDKIPEGKIKIYDYPTKTLTISRIEEHLKKLEKEQSFRADIVFVDYLDLLKPPSNKEEDVLRQQGAIAEGLRGVAGKFCIPVVTASQINRIGTGKAANTGSDVAGSYEKIAVADQIICLSASPDELSNNEMRIILAESRNNPSCTIKIKTAYSYGRFYERLVGTDD